MLTKEELAQRLGVHEATVTRWVEFGIVTRYAHNGHAYLYQDPGPNPPVKQSSRWNRLTERTKAQKTDGNQNAHSHMKEA